MYKCIRHKINNYINILYNDYIEIDVRDFQGIPCIGHDPLKNSDDPITLLWFLEECINKNVQLLAVNIKSDGNEEMIVNMLNDSKIDYFLFDMSRPCYHRYAQKTNKIALPVNEYDSVEDLKHYNTIPKYIWLDCFNGRVDKQIKQYDKIRSVYGEDVKIIFVAPDLHNNRQDNTLLNNFLNKNMENVFVCTDFVEDFK